MTNEVNLGPGRTLPCGCYLRPDETEPRFWFCDEHGGGHAHMSVVCALLQDEPTGDYVRIPWGMWSLDGSWKPNPALAMSADEQYRQNVANGFIKSSENRGR